jgi:hypothetical protein
VGEGLSRDRDREGRPRNARPRDALGRPLPRDGTTAPEDPPALDPEAALREAQRLLDSDRAFTAHEVLEAVWKSAAGADRDLWRGLAQLAVGLTHRQRGNATGAAALLRRGADNLARYTGTTPHGVDVDGLRAWSARAVDDATTAPPRLTVG